MNWGNECFFPIRGKFSLHQGSIKYQGKHWRKANDVSFNSLVSMPSGPQALLGSSSCSS